MTTTAASALTFSLVPDGRPRVSALGLTRQAYVLDGDPVFAEIDDRPARIDSVRVNVADPADINVVFLFQRAHGGDYASRDGVIESAAYLRCVSEFGPMLDAIESVIRAAREDEAGAS